MKQGFYIYTPKTNNEEFPFDRSQPVEIIDGSVMFTGVNCEYELDKIKSIGNITPLGATQVSGFFDSMVSEFLGSDNGCDFSLDEFDVENALRPFADAHISCMKTI